MNDILFFTTSGHLVLVLLFPFIIPSWQQRCGQDAQCLGNRPKLDNGCCSIEPNHTCTPEEGDDCDTDFGYICVDEDGDRVTEGQGLCRGQYNLKAVAVTTHHVNLTWDHIAKDITSYEYVVLYREMPYHHDDSAWDSKDVGEKPMGFLKDLKPGSLYFVKVGLWTGGRSPTNISETIMIQTIPLEFCQHQSNQYQVGQQFVIECEDNCTCLPTGEFKCEPVCPGPYGLPQAPEEGCEYRRGQDCCTYVMTCPVGLKTCSYNNQTYSDGSEVIIECQVCTCSLGKFECQYPQDCGSMEATLSCPSFKIRRMDESCCPEWYCETTCTYENHTYHHMEYFTSSQCGLCQCNTATGVQCAADCPPVVMVMPDAACPDPHIIKDGCCETLHCHDPNEDILQFMRRMFALSYSPVTLTVSFEVASQTEHNGVLAYCQYEVLYTNTADPQGNWSRRLVQPVDVVLQQDQNSHMEPADALSRDNAIVVNHRAYVTLSGMQPNTTYYVKIIPLDGLREDMSASHPALLNYSDRNILAMVVVKTKSLENVTSCFYDGKEVLHQETVPAGHCGQLCQCVLGQITCHSLCEGEGYVVASSSTCPVPRLERKDNECCPQWTCHPSAGGCNYHGVMMSTGQSVTEACQVCTCTNGTVHCASMCQPTDQPPKVGCELTNITGQCCPEWTCPLESHPPHGVRSSTIVQFHGNCLTPESEFEMMVSQKLHNYVTSQKACSQAMALCDTLSVLVSCSGASRDTFMNRRRRRSMPSDSSKIFVHVSVYQNFSADTTKEMTVQQVHSAGLRLLSVLNTSIDVPLDNGQSLKSTSTVIHEGITYICDRNFIYVKENDACILSQIESVQTFKPNVQLEATLISDTGAYLQWTILETQDLTQVQGFMIEYRPEGSLQWLGSHVIDSRQRSYNITSMKPDENFTVRLVAFLSWSGNSKWTVAETNFKTTTVSEPTATTFIFPLKEITVQETWAVLAWEPLTSDLVTQVSAVNIIFKQSSIGYYTYKQSIAFKSQSQVQLTGLHPNTAYTAEITMLFYSGTTKSSGLVHFVTKSLRNVSSELLVAVIISCVITLIASIIVILTCFMWNKSKKKGDATGFENKTFGIPLENNNEENPICHPSVNTHSPVTVSLATENSSTEEHES